MELTTPRLTMPTKTLLDGARYVPHYLQSTEGILARWLRNESVEFSDAECSAVAEAHSLQPMDEDFGYER